MILSVGISNKLSNIDAGTGILSKLSVLFDFNESLFCNNVTLSWFPISSCVNAFGFPSRLLCCGSSIGSGPCFIPAWSLIITPVCNSIVFNKEGCRESRGWKLSSAIWLEIFALFLLSVFFFFGDVLLDLLVFDGLFSTVASSSWPGVLIDNSNSTGAGNLLGGILLIIITSPFLSIVYSWLPYNYYFNTLIFDNCFAILSCSSFCWASNILVFSLYSASLCANNFCFNNFSSCSFFSLSLIDFLDFLTEEPNLLDGLADNLTIGEAILVVLLLLLGEFTFK